MVESLDSVVAQVVFTAKCLEKAVHDPGPWTVTWNGRTVPAHRFEIDAGVVFCAKFEEHCHLDVPPLEVSLDCADEIVTVRVIEFPGDGAFDIQWAITGRTAYVTA